MEIKRLENENQELNAAYRESETMRKQEEAKCQRLVAELTQVRHDYEKRLLQKEEELETIRLVPHFTVYFLSRWTWIRLFSFSTIFVFFI